MVIVSSEKSWLFSMARLANSSLPLLNSNLSLHQATAAASVLVSSLDSADPIQLPDPYKVPMTGECTIWNHLPVIEKDSGIEWALFVGLPVIWIALVLIGTAFSKGRLGQLSIVKSYQEMMVGRQSRLNVLDVLRVVAILWVMMNHTGSEGRIDILERLPTSFAFKKAVHEHPVFGALLGNSALGVEVFLVLSGLLAARTWQRDATMDFWPHYSKYVYRRLTRLVPSVFIFILLASGPIMRWILPRFEMTMISACGAKGLLSHIFFVGNWQEMPTCLGYLWYIGLDMQLHMVAPLFMWALNRDRRAAVAIVMLTIAVSTVLRASYCIGYEICNKSDVDIPFISYPGVNPDSIRHIYVGLWEMYARPYTKCGPFLIGLLFGWASTFWEKKQIRISRRTGTMMFVGGATLAVATIYAILPEYWWPTMSTNVYNVTYTATFRSVFAIALVAMIAALTQQNETISVHLGWSVLARLTFSAYLLHMPVVYVFNHLQYLQDADSAVALLVVLPAVAALSFAVALPFYLLIEAPIGRLSSAFERYRAGAKLAAAPAPPTRQTSVDTHKSSTVSSADLNHNIALPLLKKMEE
ncbi:hypothetical protein PFISCL1PPCAC_8333 [Pristionchus fissidentatus]|uniref:Acyltransferase 3 domain-containing protein n=1 Tax=Pristionchus fissidentatus TaxID=1538716 RepID=A0AAV5VCB5_9BILA|nr:hypothetical protein PFISCL1PPCAC_8333 [Pristionchus fissidentatus]